LKWICGYANAQGGHMDIGRNDDGVIVGIPDAKWVTGAYVKIGYFRTDDDLVYQDEIHGSLITMPDKVIDTLYTKYFKGIISYEGIQRVETYPVSIDAMREAILNAIVHKDYASGNPIQIRVYDDKVTIFNNGKLPADWSVERLMEFHTSDPHNPNIANTFFRSGMTEAWGRGIEKIVRNSLESGKIERIGINRTLRLA
jgi:ATP-dependent DNA helicase RecG